MLPPVPLPLSMINHLSILSQFFYAYRANVIYILFLSTFLYCIHYSTSLISLLIIHPDKLCIKFIENILIFKNRVVLYCIDTHKSFKYSPNDRHLNGFNLLSLQIRMKWSYTEVISKLHTYN